jgi:hypothetical protein
MDSQSWFTALNILVTIVVGIILRNQIKSQKAIIDSYKDFVSAINPLVALQLKDAEIEQVKKNMSNDIQTLQKQVSELALYANHIIEYTEKTSKDVNYGFDRDSFISNTLPSCRTILETHRDL